MASAPPAEAGRRLDFDLRGGRRELAPDRHRGHLLHRLGHHRAEPLVLADVGPHVAPVHVGTGEVELEPVRAGVLAVAGEPLPVLQLLVVAGAGHDRGDEDPVGKRLLDPPDAGEPPVEGLVGDELPVPGGVQRRAGALLHRDVGVLGSGAHELGLGPDDVDDRVEPDRLGHHAAPSGLERAKDVALRLRRRRRGEQEGIRELESRELDGSVGRHGGQPPFTTSNSRRPSRRLRAPSHGGRSRRPGKNGGGVAAGRAITDGGVFHGSSGEPRPALGRQRGRSGEARGGWRWAVPVNITMRSSGGQTSRPVGPARVSRPEEPRRLTLDIGLTGGWYR